MQVVITGGAGFLGRQLAQALLARGWLVGPDGCDTPISKLIVSDASPVPVAGEPRLEIVRGDITDPETIRSLVTADTSLIFHLAAVVSGEAEQNFDLGMQVNLMATLNLLERCREVGSRPRLVFASSVAVFGGDLPPMIEDGTALTPQSSYGTQKAVGELLVNDYSRKHFIDGRVLRLPTIVSPSRPAEQSCLHFCQFDHPGTPPGPGRGLPGDTHRADVDSISPAGHRKPTSRGPVAGGGLGDQPGSFPAWLVRFYPGNG